MDRERHPAELGPQKETEVTLHDALTYDPFEDEDEELE